MDIPSAFTQTLDDLTTAFPGLEFKPDSPDFYRGIGEDTQHMVVSYEPKPVPLVHVRVYDREHARQVEDIMRARGLEPRIKDQLDFGKIDVDAWL